MSNFLMSVVVQVMDFHRFCRGFRAKNVQVDEFEWSYIERDGRAQDETEPVVFLHGFSSIKESWVRVAGGVDKRFRVLIPDLPGHGRTAPIDAAFSYKMEDQARRIHGFIETTIPADRKVHLVGCSMGGLLAGLYAALYPERVRSLTMICPAGITMPKRSPTYEMLETTGRNLLLAHTTDDVLEMAQYLGHESAKFPRVIASALATERKRQLPVLERLAQDMLARPTVLEEHLHHIRAKTLVLWGKNDRILDISSLPILKEKLSHIPTKHFIELDKCGHVVQHERYDVCINAINAFLDDKVPPAP
ncbi:hypothetical protein PINS_up002520 [Pythium insidiosum]|nr:hypothetical protein PINS_up002520 [Pythium insidiosum]